MSPKSSVRPRRGPSPFSAHRGRGSNDLGNRTTLCAWHHLRGVHAGVVRWTGVAPHGLRFELGVRRDGAPLAVYEAGDMLVTQ